MIADIIIPFHNRADMLIRCLRALSVARPLEAEVLIVDDGSVVAERRLSEQAAAEHGGTVNWLGLPRRLGFVGAVNAAWSRCRRPMTVILNSDTVPTPDLVLKLASAFQQDPRTAAAAPVSDNPSDLYQYRPPQSTTRDVRREDLTMVPYLTGMCIALRRSAIAPPLFDPVFSPGYFEDLDVSCRLRMAGWRLRVVENCRVHHEGQASFGFDRNLRAIIARNYAQFTKRWAHLPEHQDLVWRLRKLARCNEVCA